MALKRKPFIAVIGAGKCAKKLRDQAEEVGRKIAEKGGVLVCGGLKGVMEAAARGARDAGGTTIGILPGENKSDANQYIEYPIPTGIGEARNIVIIKTADAVIALPGKFGTLSEMAFAMKLGKPLVAVSAWNIDDSIEQIADPTEAVERAFKLIEGAK